MSRKPEKVIKDLCTIGGPDITTASVSDLADCLQSRERGSKWDYISLIDDALKKGWLTPKYVAQEGDKPAKFVGYTPSRKLEVGESAPRRAADTPLVLSLKRPRVRSAASAVGA